MTEPMGRKSSKTREGKVGRSDSLIRSLKKNTRCTAPSEKGRGAFMKKDTLSKYLGWKIATYDWAHIALYAKS